MTEQKYSLENTMRNIKCRTGTVKTVLFLCHWEVSVIGYREKWFQAKLSVSGLWL